MARPNRSGSYRRYSQRAPYPGAGASVQNAALSSALQGPDALAPPEDGPPRVIPQKEGFVAEGAIPRLEASVSAPQAPTAPQAQPQPPQAQPSPYAGKWGYETIQDAYKKHLGREGGESEILSHLGGGKWLDFDSKYLPSVNSAVQSIYNSPEANAYRQNGVQSDPGVGGVGTPSAPPSAPAAPTRTGNNPQSTNTFQWGQQHQFRGDVYGQGAGFDLARPQNPDKSAKDAFLFAAQQGAAADAFQQASLDKAATEQWFRQYIMPSLIERGYEVVDVKGDQAYIRSWDGEGWVDYVAGAGAPGASLAWQPQGGAGAAPMAAGGGASMPSGSPLAGLNQNDPAFYQKLLAYLMQQLGA